MSILKNNPVPQDTTVSAGVVYVVDRDEAIGEALTMLLSTYSIDVHCYPDAQSFLNDCAAFQKTHSCLLADVNLSDMSGMLLLQRLRAQGHQMPVILLADSASGQMRERALHLGAVDVIDKPFSNGLVIERLSVLLD